MFNISIGKGIWVEGMHHQLALLDWSTGIHYLNLKMAIPPIAPSIDWNFEKEWINLGTTIFGVVPYALNVIGDKSRGLDSSLLNIKLNIADTSAMLLPYAKVAYTPNMQFITTQLNQKLNVTDSTIHFVTPSQLNAKIYDTTFLSNRVDLRELLENKSNNLSSIADYSDIKYPTVKSVKDYIDNISVSSTKIQDDAITDTKIAFGIQSSKVGLGNVTNHAQLYNLNGLTSQVQKFAQPGLAGFSPHWLSIDSSHILNIPMANAAAVTAGLISKAEYDRFNSTANSSINSITTMGNVGTAVLSGQVLNIPNYTLTALAGNVNANQFFAGPTTGANGTPGFRHLVANDIPNNYANTTGNAASATKLQSVKNINQIPFDGTTDITITANTNNGLSFSNDGLGVNAGTSFNGSLARIISYNTIGASPLIGSSSINTVGTITNGIWAANIIGENYGGAGTNNGILKADGSGLVTTAIAGTDYITPFGIQTTKQFFAAPISSNGSPIFRNIEVSDIPQLNQHTTGNAATASALQNNILINGTSFNGSNDITITANTNTNLTFNNAGSGENSPSVFNGSAAKTISYNTIGAAPSIGSSAINTLGTITTGTWSATVIGANFGGAGNNNGLLKSDGNGNVSTAIAGTDFQSPLIFSSPFTNTSNSISLAQADGFNNGYLTSADWISFHNKIDANTKGVQNGVASLDANGKVPTSQIPAISFSSGYVVTSQSAMLALANAVVGSIAIRTDNNFNYVLSALPASILSNWLQLLMPAAITSVNGNTNSVITLSTLDIAENNNLYFTDARSRAAMNVNTPLTYNAGTGVISLPAASINTAGYLSSSDWNTFNNKLSNFSNQVANRFFAGPSSGANASPSFRTIVATDIPTLNQNTTGNAATATALQNPRTINGVIFDGSSNITIASSISNAVSFNNSGSGMTSPTSFDGTAAKTISYNTIGASPLNGSGSLTTVGTITSGVWNASVIDANHGGAGSTNGILKANGNGQVSAAIVNTDYLSPFGSQTSKYFYAAPNATNGSPIFRSILASDIPTLNQHTTGNAATATTLQNPRTINGVAFDGSSNITITSTNSNAINFIENGSGSSSPVSFDGTASKTISYNTIGASPLAGSSNITSVGILTSGSWNANVIGSNYGGAGSINGILKANGSGMVSAANPGSDFENPLSFTSPMSRSANSISIPSATSSSNGYLTSTDWTTFNNKQTTIAAGTGVTITGGNSISIGQAIASSSSPSFAGLNVTGDVTSKRYKLTMPSTITATATTNIDLSTGNVFTVNLSVNINSLTFTNPGVGTYLIKFVQNIGNKTVTFPAAWKWSGGLIPTITTTVNKLDIVTLIYDGTTYYATIVKNF